MTISDKKLRYDNRAAANISAFSSANIDKCELWENSGCFDDHDLLIKGFNSNEHRFRHNCINQLCCCSFEVENTLHFFLHCQHYWSFRMDLMNKVNQIDEHFSYLSDDNKVSLLLYGDSRFDDNKSNFILSASITYILETERFSTSLFQSDVPYR